MEVKDAYKNLERIVIYGFLSVRISLLGHDLLIKSISDKEFSNINMLCSNKDQYKLNLFNLAFSTVSLDGFNVIEDRNNFLYKIFNFYKRSSALFTSKIIEILNELNFCYIDSLNCLEGFCYSDRSRYLWTILDMYKRSNYVGINGIDTLGINSVQESWIHINKRLDEEDVYTKNLNNSLLIVSATNQKGAKALSKSYEAQRTETEELRKEICKHGYDKKRVEENKKKREEWTAPLQSREDLVRELNRQMSGKKDKHDLFIEEWKNEQIEKAERAKKSVEEKQKAFREKIDKLELDLLEPSRAISTEELDKIIKEKEKKKSNKTYMSESADKERKDRVLKKIGAKIIRPEMKGT